MAFDISTFKAKGLPKGGARPSLFQVQMNALPLGDTDTQSQISFVCQAATLPASEVDPIEIPYFGRRIKVAGERVFRDWTINILNDEDFKIRDLFEAWSNMENTMETNVTNGASLLGYKADGVSVNQFSKGGPISSDPNSTDSIIRSYKFWGMFPTRLGDIRLDWSQGQAIETYDVVLAYDYWVPGDVGSFQYTGLEDGAGSGNS